MNPAEKAINNLSGPSAVGGALDISRQAVNSWKDKGVPTYLIRAVSIASGVPLEEFLEFEERKHGVDAKALAKRLKNVAEDRSS